MNTPTYKDQWMVENIPEVIHPLDTNMIMMKNLFFEENKNHSYSIMRLFWLSRWIRELEDFSVEHYQNEYLVNKKLKLLFQLWMRDYFHPFITAYDAYDIVSNDKNKYVLGLSSTIPGSIRITYWKDGVKHHRIDLHTYTSKGHTEVIDYDIVKLESVIQKYIQNNSISKISCEYGV